MKCIHCMNCSENNDIIDGINRIIIHTLMFNKPFGSDDNLDDNKLKLSRDILNELVDMNIIKNPKIEFPCIRNNRILLVYEIPGMKNRMVSSIVMGDAE